MPIILSVFPKEFDRYIEIFGGSGAVLLGKPESKFEVYNDIDGELVNLFRVIKNRPAELLLELGLLPLNSRAEFNDWLHFSQSLQMMERPLLTADELKSMPKGSFVVMKTGCHPMRTKLKLFLHWGIRFGEPLEMPDQGTRPVYYAGKRELERAILCTYPPTRTAEAAIQSALTDRPIPHLGTPAKLNLEDE